MIVRLAIDIYIEWDKTWVYKYPITLQVYEHWDIFNLTLNYPLSSLIETEGWFDFHETARIAYEAQEAVIAAVQAS